MNKKLKGYAAPIVNGIFLAKASERISLRIYISEPIPAKKMNCS